MRTARSQQREKLVATSATPCSFQLSHSASEAGASGGNLQLRHVPHHVDKVREQLSVYEANRLSLNVLSPSPLTLRHCPQARSKSSVIQKVPRFIQREEPSRFSTERAVRNSAAAARQNWHQLSWKLEGTPWCFIACARRTKPRLCQKPSNVRLVKGSKGPSAAMGADADEHNRFCSKAPDRSDCAHAVAARPVMRVAAEGVTALAVKLQGNHEA
eukprot:CAMPEP_0178445300 /NCGR_PEP_ID=MMETSP0689_2-20121128/40067_1 /TAXON_ID=160604 /ORGANISM="Amphidinium massartii, Strain CS-259" /LENGTH=214 /DNA_ID=CAMNT_0020069789 /DNA_START=96 /DNA_END=738 /DNA_ORIENTATION=-